MSTQFKKDSIFVQDSYQEVLIDDYNPIEVESHSQSQEVSEIVGENVNQNQEICTTDGNPQRNRQKYQDKYLTISNTMEKINYAFSIDEMKLTEDQSSSASNYKKKSKKERHHQIKQIQNQNMNKDNNNYQNQYNVRKPIQKNNNKNLQYLTKKVKEKKKYLQNYHEKPEKNMKSYFNRLLPKKIHPKNRKQHILECIEYLKSFKVLDDILSSKQLINVETPIKLLPRFYANKKLELEKIDR